MGRRILVVLAVVALGACGSDDASPAVGSAGDSTAPETATPTSTPTSTPTPTPATTLDTAAAVAARAVSEIESAGYTVQPECVRDIVDQLSPEDLALLAADVDNTSPDASDPELSPDGEELTDGILACLDGGASQEMIDAVVQMFVDSPDGDMLDADCLRENLRALSDEQLQVALDAEPDSTDPKLMGVAALVFDCADFMQDAGGTLPVAEAELLDPCTVLTEDERASLLAGVDPDGTAQSVMTVYGNASACTWEAPEGMNLTVTVTGAPDVEAWEAESSNGNGVGDGEPVEVGELAFASDGHVTFLSSPWLVDIKVFPSFAAEQDAVLAVATAVADRL